MLRSVRIVLPGLLFLATASALANDQRHDWFKSLHRPGTGISCCDIADCRPTEAKWQGNRWWAVVLGQWQLIPPESVLKSPHSLDGNAYVCLGESHEIDGHKVDTLIYCFVPPDLGS